MESWWVSDGWGSVDGSTYLIVVMSMALSRSCRQYFERADIVEGVFGLVVQKQSVTNERKDIEKGNVSKTWDGGCGGMVRMGGWVRVDVWGQMEDK
jgi:hypothetical protein